MAAALDRGVAQVALVGAGLDFRPFRFADRAGVRWFELDLPEMLEERARVLAGHALPPCDRTAVPVNLDFDDPAEVLAGTGGFDPEAPVFVVYEGCSMYFEAPKAHEILGRLAGLVRRHPDSRLWLDLVTPEVVGRDTPPAARSFVEGMARMGEPFVFGHGDPAALFAGHGLAVETVARSNHYRPSDDPLFELYYFAVLGPSAPQAAAT